MTPSLRLASSVAALTAAGVLPALAQDSVTFSSFGGTYQEAQRIALLEPAAEALGIAIREDTLTGIAEVRAQVLAGAVSWDIVDLGMNDCALAEAEGILEPLDYSLISTEGFADAAYSDAWVGTIYYSTVLAYDEDVVGDNPPQSWADFWDVENFPGARALYNHPVTLELALMADGVPLDEIYPLDLDRAFAKMDEIRPHVDVWWSTGAQSAQLIADGEVDMLPIWNGRLDAVVADGVPAGMTFNQGVLSLDCLAIPRGAANKDLAMQVIAEILKPDYQARMVEHINYGPTSALAFEEGVITPEQEAISPSAPDNIAVQLITDADFWAENRPAIQERWDAFMTR